MTAPASVILSDGTTATVGSRVRATLESVATETAYHARYRDEAGDLARKRIALARDGCVVAELTTSACGPWTIVAVRLSDGALGYAHPSCLESAP